MKAKQLIDQLTEVEGLSLKVSVIIPSQVVGVKVKLETIVPTGPVPYNLVKHLAGSAREGLPRDISWAAGKIYGPARENLCRELDRQYPAMAYHLRKELKRWLGLELNAYGVHPAFVFSLVTPTGEPVPRRLLVPLERELALAKLTQRGEVD